MKLNIQILIITARTAGLAKTLVELSGSCGGPRGIKYELAATYNYKRPLAGMLSNFKLRGKAEGPVCVSKALKSNVNKVPNVGNLDRNGQTHPDLNQ